MSNLGLPQVRHIFTEVSQGRGRHGHFLMYIAHAACNADPQNMTLIMPVLLELIQKYELQRYLDTFQENA